jgi:hypothetical protein
VTFDQEADLCFSPKGLKAGQSSLQITFSFVLILFDKAALPFKEQLQDNSAGNNRKNLNLLSGCRVWVPMRKRKRNLRRT